MKTSLSSVALFTALALGLTVGRAALADDAQQPTPADPQTAASSAHAQIAESTLSLEKAFAEQFVNGQIDRQALSPLVAAVLSATPEAARPALQAHIDRVLANGEKLVAQTTPEQRAQMATPPAADKAAPTLIAQVTAFGWPDLGGWGGTGAFGFPDVYGSGYGYGYPGYGYGYPGSGYGYGYPGYGYTTSGYPGYGYAVGYPGYGVYGGYGGYGLGYGTGYGASTYRATSTSWYW